ncbi:YraN family protein [Amycolatopsis sp. PS_44_ISF1]|uniref:YraN family protein n=1 Tax=Amycolatopsis sp. PS_44_ISF1 TaxID=2974917 RepID=UPI0028DE0E03|nr:YraN family protein [Amycolatopsis sp. PS_44_ISF1]MDT8915471.1 YraN family protein [Amycolatopsis sp. PS_44_ISF1]
MKDSLQQRARWRREFGRWGEDLAARYLQAAGLVLLSRNWSCREGELDLVLSEGERVVFCEVKTRSGDEYGTPSESVTPEKADRVRKAAEQWLRVFGVGWCRTRYDVVAVFAPVGGQPSVRHIAGAF